MLLLSVWGCLLLSVLVNAACIHPRDMIPASQHRRCAVSNPPAELRDILRTLEALERTTSNLLGALFGDRTAEPHKSRVVVDTYIHVLASNESARPTSPDYLSEKQLNDTFTYLSRSFSQTAISFALKNVTRTTNDRWARNRDEYTMKSTLRQGTYSALNIYFYDQLDEGILGSCGLPQPSPGDYTTDGCNLLAGTVVGGTIPRYSGGATTVHEVGHFFGLLHTFEGQTCSNASWGDYVSDTPQHSKVTYGCPTGVVDSCPDSGVAATADAVPGPQGYSGPDPIHNFMNYSDDDCLEEFTPGQGIRMLSMYERFRKGK